MSLRAADIEAIVPAAGQGTRLGLGPKAFVTLSGRTLLEHVVTTLLAVAARVTVAVPPTDLQAADRLVGGARIRIVAGGMRRIDTVRLLIEAGTAPWLLLHDVAHPFATKELAQRVLDEAPGTGAAAAALANVDFLYGMDGTLRANPGTVVAIQKPIAFRRADAVRGLAAADRAAGGAPVHDMSVLEILEYASQRVAFVPGHPLNFKLTTAEDFELARRLMA